ncbi:MAG TPA: sugar ABC transporter ATP-binding protein [Termitinemataceae bacterium]|jgi:simple sugar transport system ATP-binding protein|nr:sugar ABC transporter ATP-binding protein [Termitinemataceae bacterium]HOM23398.1 sugar ABC transporter ATP-binding protein [Termitinemataceae bacterium]HPQ01261.1 sugar ABC transporter ATP-binding protein [Termitinemataceae bacterium]
MVVQQESKGKVSPPILEMKDISKYFPGVRALSRVNFSLRPGEIHALMGQNGAGKSTLIKIMTGVYHPDGGSIWLDGAKITVESPEHAESLGIATVYQEVNLCPNLSVAENVLLGREPRKGPNIDWKKMYATARQILQEKLELTLDPTAPLGSYSLAIQQMVAIARALCIQSRILILDEPTSSLDDTEVARLFVILRKLKQEGLAILFVTHFLDQVYEISDVITVLRNGEYIGTLPTKDLPKIELISMMVGKDPLDLAATMARGGKKEESSAAASAGVLPEQEFVRAENLGKEGYLKPINLAIQKGEVLGLAGLLGSGRTETAKLLFGAERAGEGTIFYQDEPVTIQHPLDAMMIGMGFCPEDRKTEGLVADLSIRENIILALQAKRGVFRYLPRKTQEVLAEELIKELGIKTPDAERPVRSLSGGNQQKVLLARWLATDPQILILDEPTRGIDVAAKSEILQRILDLKKRGISIVFISSELEEVVAVSDRVAVFRDKKKIGEIRGAQIQEHTIMRLIAQGETEHATETS